MNYSVTQFGKELDKSKYTFDETTKTFSSLENNLVLDFNNINNCTFDTGSDCTFNTGFNCTFDTGSDCTFKTGSSCTFKTGSSCTFDTGSNCTFKTGSSCTFDTGSDCTFDTDYNCTFNTGSNCVVIRRDIFEVILLEKNREIKLNLYNIKGFTHKKTKYTLAQLQEKLGEEFEIIN